MQTRTCAIKGDVEKPWTSILPFPRSGNGRDFEMDCAHQSWNCVLWIRRQRQSQIQTVFKKIMHRLNTSCSGHELTHTSYRYRAASLASHHQSVNQSQIYWTLLHLPFEEILTVPALYQEGHLQVLWFASDSI